MLPDWGLKIGEYATMVKTNCIKSQQKYAETNSNIQIVFKREKNSLKY